MQNWKKSVIDLQMDHSKACIQLFSTASKPNDKFIFDNLEEAS